MYDTYQSGSFFFVFNDLRWTLVFRFVDIGGIGEHQWLNCLVLMCVNLIKFIKLILYIPYQIKQNQSVLLYFI